eukprot:g3852.t1
MKRAQIEEARKRAQELLDEERQRQLEWEPPSEKDFTVHAHLLRKKLKTMAEPLGETARHANFIVTQEKLVIIPKLKHKLVMQEIKNATIVHTGAESKMSFKHYKTWTLQRKPTDSLMFVQTMFSLVAIKKSLQRNMIKRNEILDELKQIKARRLECKKVVEREGYPFLKEVLQSDLKKRKIKLKIKTSLNNKHLIELDSTEPILKLKKRLQTLDNIEKLENIHVIFQGNIIDFDELSLAECGIENKQSLDVLYTKFPMEKTFSRDLKDLSHEVMATLDDDLDEFEDPNDFIEEVAYLRDFVHQVNNAVHHINVAPYQAKYKKKLRNNARQNGGKTRTKRVVHNKKGRRSDFIHGYEIIVDPAVLVRVGATELSRASLRYEDTYQKLIKIERDITKEFIVCIQRNWRFKLWIKKSNKRAAWIKGKKKRLQKSLHGFDNRKLQERRKISLRNQQLKEIQERKAATLMQRRFKQFMRRKYPPNGRPWKETKRGKGNDGTFNALDLIGKKVIHKCRICLKDHFKNYDELRVHINEHKARDRQRKWRLEAEAAQAIYEKELWEKRTRERHKRKLIQDKEASYLNEVRRVRLEKAEAKRLEAERRLLLGMDLPYTPQVAVLYLYRQDGIDPEVYNDLPDKIYLRKSITSIGRGESADVQIKSKYARKLLSRAHCTFFVEIHKYSGRVQHVSVVDDGSTNGTFVDGFEVFADPTKLRSLNSANLKGKDGRNKLNASSLAQKNAEISSLDRVELLVTSRSSINSNALQFNNISEATISVATSDNKNYNNSNLREFLISRGSTLQSTDTFSVISDKNGGSIASSEAKTDVPSGDGYEIKHGVALKEGSLITFGCAPGHPSGLSHLLYQLEIKNKPRY